ncbi:MAG TPA: hypothetical protein VL651_00515 [Bacteroidia bacterium]|jgi:hypothetical protein|nr:hypothetical protein [Bacteroidia bacterium]
MIEEFARAVGTAFGLKNEGRDEDALNEIRGAYKTWFALDGAAITAMSSEEFLKFLTDEKQFTLKQISALAEGLKAEAELLPDTSIIEKQDRYSKALFLLEFVDMTDTSTYSPERQKMISDLKMILMNDL